MSGQPSVLYFANRIFEQAGLGFEAALVIGLFKLAMTFASALLVENPNFGRRTLLLYGNTGQGSCTIYFSSYETFSTEICALYDHSTLSSFIIGLNRFFALILFCQKILSMIMMKIQK